LVSDREGYLASYEWETAAELQEQIPHVCQQTTFELPFPQGVRERQKIEVIWVARVEDFFV